MVIEAGQTLAKRFKEKGQYLRSFVADESLFIDIMMNVGIIFYAADETDDDDLFQVANQHCLTSRRYLVRGDGSTSHEGLFNLETGEFIRQSTHQGWRDDSSWAGTGLVALRIRHRLRPHRRCPLPANGAEQCSLLHRTHAGSRRAAQRLGRAGSQEPPREFSRRHHRQWADEPVAAGRRSHIGTLLRRVRPADRRHADHTHLPRHRHTGLEGILKQGMYHERRGLGVNESVMWGDYFFLEAVSKVLGYE
ncbi:MAG: hypothetical protein R2873_08855 [Caldilineaceae bacterium]